MRLLLAVLAGLVLFALPALPRDGGQWEEADPSIGEWFRHLMQPDNKVVSCCGESDAYWADSFEVDKDGNTVAIITDMRPDAPLNRPHIEPGTKIRIPPNKVMNDGGNPTGHFVLFVGSGGTVFCYVTGSFI